jgi:hypothetical protein
MGDPNLGTWILNVAKSKYDPGPPPASETAVLEAWEGDGVKLTVTRVLADGIRITGGFSAHYDGKDHEVAGNPDFDALAYRRLDANTTSFTVKKGGTVVGTGNAVVSNNGKVRTITSTATNAKGQKENIVAVYDRQ